MTTLTMSVDGMSCGHCVARVTKTLAEVPGVTVEQVTIGRAVVTLDPARAKAEAIVERLNDAGYPARVA
ncbi:MAG: cation transporter [Vicinamibacterales bacterium]